ncbi:MAG: SIS domain-containing protein [Chloroflexota bacterium]
MEQENLNKIQALFERSIALKQEVINHHLGVIVEMADIITQSLTQGGKILLCGNGGSAADAQHIATELLVRLRPHVNRQSVPALALAFDSSALTASGNDYGFDSHFERMTQGLGQKGDVLLGITTSGNSKNVIRALQAARKKEMAALAFLGSGGGPALPECDLALVVPSNETGRIQEVHITAGHALMELVEDQLLAADYLTLTE